MAPSSPSIAPTAPTVATHDGATPPFSPDDLRLLHRQFAWRDAPYALRHHFNQVAFDHLRRRAEEIATLRTADDWRRRQRLVREQLIAVFGPFPERTPLNPRVTGTLRRDGYCVDKVIFESQPGFYVTGCLFLPDPLPTSANPAPAILNPIGHTDIAFRAEMYQLLALNLVRKGFIVLSYDPPGQGERLQYFDPQTGASRVGRSTAEHSYAGRQAFLAGRSIATDFAWDGIRAVDYLLTRPEVDPQRIGITGLSGGGTQTAYVAALDDRILAAAPTCYIAGFRRLLESIGPQDAEQNPVGFVAAGLDHADFLEVRAPKPALVVATTRDFFSIQGARETSAEVARAYAAFGAPDAFGHAEDDHGHGYTRLTREAIYAFFQRALDLPGDSRDEPVDILSAADLTVTPTGQLSTSPGIDGATLFSLNRAHVSSLVEDLSSRRHDLATHLPNVRETAARLSGYRPSNAPIDVVFAGRLHHPNCAVEKVMLSGDSPTLTPALVLVPNGTSGAPAAKYPAALFLHPDGKAAALEPGSSALALVRRGWIVCAPDLSGRGELTTQTNHFEPVLTGGSLPGIHAAEIVRAARYLLARDDVRAASASDPNSNSTSKVAALATGSLAPALLHAATLGDSIGSLALLDAPLTWAAMALNREYDADFSSVVPGALAAYDLPDLAACLAPAPLAVVNPVDHLRQPLSAGALASGWQVVRDAYRGAGAESSLVFHTGVADPAQAIAATLGS